MSNIHSKKKQIHQKKIHEIYDEKIRQNGKLGETMKLAEHRGRASFTPRGSCTVVFTWLTSTRQLQQQNQQHQELQQQRSNQPKNKRKLQER